MEEYQMMVRTIISTYKENGEVKLTDFLIECLRKCLGDSLKYTAKQQDQCMEVDYREEAYRLREEMDIKLKCSEEQKIDIERKLKKEIEWLKNIINSILHI